MIMKKLESSKGLANDLSNIRFGQAPRVKVNKKDYADTMRSMHLSGKINLSEIILRTHKAEPYKSVDELIGDLQIVLMESWNEFRNVNPSNMGKLDINDLVDQLPEQVRQ